MRFLFPRLTVGQRQRWWLWRAGPALAVGDLIAILVGWPVALIATGLILFAGALFSHRISPASPPPPGQRPPGGAPGGAWPGSARPDT